MAPRLAPDGLFRANISLGFSAQSGDLLFSATAVGNFNKGNGTSASCCRCKATCRPGATDKHSLKPNRDDKG
jgi:hypothetical protein